MLISKVTITHFITDVIVYLRNGDLDVESNLHNVQTAVRHGRYCLQHLGRRVGRFVAQSRDKFPYLLSRPVKWLTGLQRVGSY